MWVSCRGRRLAYANAFCPQNDRGAEVSGSVNVNEGKALSKQMVSPT